jgi:hypothetical protein
MRFHAMILGLFAAFPFTALSQQDGTAAISGRLVDDSGRAIARANVNYRRIDDLRRRDKFGGYVVTSTPVNRLVTTSADGSFAVAGLPPGNYQVCAFANLPNQVGTCEWHRNQGPFAVEAGRTVRIPDLVLVTGRTLRIRVLDPNAKLTARAKLRIGVMTEAGYYKLAEPAVGPRENGAAAILSVVVPPNASVGLFVDSDLDVRDSSLIPVVKGKRSSAIALGPPNSETVLDLRLN